MSISYLPVKPCRAHLIQRNWVKLAGGRLLADPPTLKAHLEGLVSLMDT